MTHLSWPRRQARGRHAWRPVYLAGANQRTSPLTDFEHYYQRIRRQQKRDTLLWSLLLLALYLAAGSVAEFNLVTVWQSLPHFFDYIGETLPVLH